MTYEIDVNGVKLCETYGLALDSYSDKPPTQKTTLVTIPGRDGALDLSEWLTGTPLYSDRTITCTLYPLDTEDWQDIERRLTELRSFLHGRRYPFSLSWDPEYTYVGRWTLTTQTLDDQTVAIKLQAICEPYKSRGTKAYILNGELGKTYIIDGPAKQTAPLIECQTQTIISINGISAMLEPGMWTNQSLVLHHGKNTIHANTTPDYGVAVWKDYTGDTWDKYQGLRLGYLARAGKDRLKSIKWAALKDKTWDKVHGTWHENAYVGDQEAHEGNDVTITFKWKDI